MHKNIYIIEDDPHSFTPLFRRMLNYFVRTKQPVEIFFIIIQKSETLYIDAMNEMEEAYNRSIEDFKKDGKDVVTYFTFNRSSSRFVIIPTDIYHSDILNNITSEVTSCIDQNNSVVMLDIVLVTDGGVDENRLMMSNPQLILSHYLYVHSHIKQHCVIYTNYREDTGIGRKWLEVLKHQKDSSNPRVNYRADMDGSFGVPTEFLNKLLTK
jgi:hypothetical protein